MVSNPFKFKQFTIHQDKTAMKVGTDGVLLGAWVDINSTINSILDVGTGTGLISLILAQRSNCEIIDAVELEENAYIQAVENFERSKWADRLFCYHSSFQNFALEIDEKYDLIISNPPFYNSTYKKLGKARAMARHTKNLTFKKLLKGVTKLLSKDGCFALIIPFSEEDKFIELAKKILLFPKKITRVRGMSSTAIKRSLIQFSFSEEIIHISEISIEKNRHNYTQKYINIVKDFYIKM